MLAIIYTLLYTFRRGMPYNIVVITYWGPLYHYLIRSLSHTHSNTVPESNTTNTHAALETKHTHTYKRSLDQLVSNKFWWVISVCSPKHFHSSVPLRWATARKVLCNVLSMCFFSFLFYSPLTSTICFVFYIFRNPFRFYIRDFPRASLAPNVILS